MSNVFGLAPTKEQHALFNRAKTGENVVAIAYAGAGKTTSMEMLTTMDPRTGLYIVYNAANRKEAQKRFPDYMRPVTGHSLAFRPMIIENPGLNRKFEAAKGGRRIPVWEIVSAAGIRSFGNIPGNRIAGMVLRTIEQFQNSADLELQKTHVPDKALPAAYQVDGNSALKEALKNEVVLYAEKIWARMANPSDPFPILHDTYLKLFQLSNPRLQAERILCDEFQDANPVLKAIVANQECQKIYVGDPYQQIYSWRGAVNALQEERMKGTATQHLSTSFRFGNQVASLANILLSVRGETVPMRGAGPTAQPFDDQQPHTIIARNNITLFEHAIDAIESNKPFALVGGADELIRLVESGYALYRDQLEEIKDEELRGYQSWGELRDIVEITQDASLKHLITVIEKYKGNSISFTEHLSRAGRIDESTVDTVLTTAHKSKGREFSQTHLCDDLELGDKVLKKVSVGEELTQEENEAFNVLYVAATRCRNAIKLSPKVRSNFLTLREVARSIQRESEASEPGMRVG